MSDDNQIGKAKPLDGYKVLLVDDDARNLFALTKVIKKRGAELIVAENGLEAISRLKEDGGIDIILMDIMMPEMDGYEAILRIRSLNAFSDLPIIALTANAMIGDREKCIEAGASDYLSKPIDVKGLVEKMVAWLGNNGSGDRVN